MQVVQDIVSVAGEFVNSRVDNEDYEGGNFMRVRVKVDVTKPLSRGRKIGLRNGEESWASFKYKHLPNLCYWCGQLTHHDKGCSIWLNRKGTLRESDQQFGSWLRAVTLNLAKKTVVRIAGHEAEVREDNRDATGRARREEGGSEARIDELNHSELSELDEQQPRVVHVGLEDVVNLEKSTSVGMLSAQVGGVCKPGFSS